MAQAIQVAHFIQSLARNLGQLIAAAGADLQTAEFLVSKRDIHAQESHAPTIGTIGLAQCLRGGFNLA